MKVLNNKKEIDSQHTVDVVRVTLNTVLTVLNAPKVIDYLSLDVEGAETLVVENFDFSNYTFLILTVERPDKRFHAIMVENGYWWVNRIEIEGDMLYLHESNHNFETIMHKYRGSNPVHRWAPRAQPHEYLLTPKWPKEN